MKKLSLLLLCFAFINFASAQNTSVKGIVVDTLNKQNLGNSSVSILRAKDSVLVKFTRTDKDGKFELTNLPAGKHVVMITYPAFADYFEAVDLESNPSIDLGNVRLTLKSKLLEDVMVRTRIAAIRLKGDTIEYKADSFKVSAGASVEEMLRKLPGLQVDKDGNITAQGTKVEKVLVDGEEFFGDDPTMATKNLQADAIDKVQVFDKKSDQAAFTGIDDGQSKKTLNLTLKEEKKKGYFGKAELKGGLDNRWSNSLMINKFKGKRKLSGYGIMSSTGTTGLNWGDRESFGSGSNMEYNADEGFFFSSMSGDEFETGNGTFGGEGIPKSWSSGLNYSNKFRKDKVSLNGSYRYNKLINDGGGSTFTQTILPDTVFFNRENRDFLNRRQRHSLNGTYEIQLDSFTSLKVTARGFTGTQASYNSFIGQAFDGNNNVVNKNLRNTFSDGTNSSFNSNFILRKRFRKPGRTISLSFDEQYKKNENEGFLFSVAEFYGKTGRLTRIDTTDQQKINLNEVLAYSTRLAYTEPIVKNTFLELSYGLRLTQSESKRLAYEKGFGGKYDVLDPRFSNHFDFSVLTNTGGMMMRYNTKKITLSGGGDIGFSNFSQEDLMKDTVRKYNFTNLFPRGNFQYKFNPNSRVSVNYNGNTRQPTIEQIQPVRDNTNNLNIAIGNPNLRQEFRHTIGLNYNFYKVLTQRGLYTYSNFTKISNAITTNDRVSVSPDSAGFRTFQFVNVDGNYMFFAGGGYNFKIKKLDMNVDFGFNINGNHTNTFINNRPNESDNNSYGFNMGLYKYKEKRYNFNYRVNISYNTSVSSVRREAKVDYYQHTHNINANATFLKKFEINSTVQANFRERLTAADVNNNVILWNGFIGRKFLKNDKGMIRLEAFDILDQNKGFSRFTSTNMVRENTYETLRRYFLLAFVWNFSNTPGGAPKSGMIIH
jgi:hypothetical protein